MPRHTQIHSRPSQYYPMDSKEQLEAQALTCLIGDRLRRARVAAGLSLSELQVRTGEALTKSRISNYEQGLRRMSIEVARTLATALGNCSAAWLLTVDDGVPALAGPREEDQPDPADVAYAHFEARARGVHGDRYDYEPARGHSLRHFDRVPIRCPEHGIFEQVINDHLRGCDCPACSRVQAAAKRSGRAKGNDGQRVDERRGTPLPTEHR